MMTLVRLIQDLRRDFHTWDKSSQAALVIALGLCVIFGLAILIAPVEWRQLAMIGLVGLIFVMQVIVLWANRAMIAPYTQAQKRFMEGDFEQARALLEQLRDSGKANMRVLTLLGNTYRQLGKLDESEIELRKALDKESLHPFPLYGFGRTLLSKGNYHEAVIVLEKSVHAGTMVAQFDLGETHYRLGQWQEAKTHLQAVRPSLQEPYRALMADYLLYRLGAGEPPSPTLLHNGLPYWQETAARLGNTPYGNALVEDIDAMHILTEERNA
jgi:tetratricopeptide (TPR) repeat protein